MSPSTNEFPLERVAGSVLRRSRPRLARTVRAAAFWTAVALPFAYLHLLWGGLTAPEVGVFFALLAVNAVALVLGHEHGSEHEH